MIIEDSMVNRTAGLLGEIESYDVKTNLDNETYQKENTDATDNSSDPFSQISVQSIMQIKFSTVLYH